MNFSRIPGKIYFNNKFIVSNKANVHVLNHSLHFASSVFEGIGVYDKKPLFIKEHFKRLFLSAKLMGLKMNCNQRKLEKITYRIIKQNNLRYGYIRSIVFRSTNSMTPDTKECRSLFAIAGWEWKKMFGKKNGISLHVSKWPRLNQDIYPIAAKSSGSYQTSVIAKKTAHKKGFDDCLMLDLKKNIAESSTCNIFWIKRNTIYTPLTHSILNGITRQAIIKLCKKLRIKCLISNYKLSKILKADVVFLTGTAAEIQIVNKINRKRFKINNDLINLLKNNYDKVKKKSPDLVSEI